MDFFDWELSEEHEAELGKKNQRSVEEVEKYALSEDLGDVERAAQLLSHGDDVQRFSIVNRLGEIMVENDASDTIHTLLPMLEPILEPEGAALQVQYAVIRALAHAVLSSAATTAILHAFSDSPRPSGSQPFSSAQSRPPLPPNTISPSMFRSNIMPTLLHVLSCAREERLLRAAVGALEPMLVLLPRDAIAREVVTFVESQSDVSRPFSQRVAAALLLGSVVRVGVVDPAIVRAKMLRVLSALAQDTEYPVRRAACEQLEVLARAMPPDLLTERIVHDLVELLRDEEIAVRQAAIKTATTIMDLFAAQPAALVTVLDELSHAFRAKGHTVRWVLAHSVGPLLNAFADAGLVESEAAGDGSSPATSPADKGEARWRGREATPFINHWMALASRPEMPSRRLCAHQLPAAVRAAGPQRFTRRVLPTLERLAGDVYPTVRGVVASHLPTLAMLLDAPLAFSHVAPLASRLLRDSSEGVAKCAATRIYVLLPVLCRPQGGGAPTPSPSSSRGRSPYSASRPRSGASAPPSGDTSERGPAADSAGVAPVRPPLLRRAAESTGLARLLGSYPHLHGAHGRGRMLVTSFGLSAPPALLPAGAVALRTHAVWAYDTGVDRKTQTPHLLLAAALTAASAPTPPTHGAMALVAALCDEEIEEEAAAAEEAASDTRRGRSPPGSGPSVAAEGVVTGLQGRIAARAASARSTPLGTPSPPRSGRGGPPSPTDSLAPECAWVTQDGVSVVPDDSAASAAAALFSLASQLADHDGRTLSGRGGRSGVGAATQADAAGRRIPAAPPGVRFLGAGMCLPAIEADSALDVFTSRAPLGGVGQAGAGGAGAGGAGFAAVPSAVQGMLLRMGVGSSPPSSPGTGAARSQGRAAGRGDGEGGGSPRPTGASSPGSGSPQGSFIQGGASSSTATYEVVSRADGWAAMANTGSGPDAGREATGMMLQRELFAAMEQPQAQAQTQTQPQSGASGASGAQSSAAAAAGSGASSGTALVPGGADASVPGTADGCYGMGTMGSFLATCPGGQGAPPGYAVQHGSLVLQRSRADRPSSLYLGTGAPTQEAAASTPLLSSTESAPDSFRFAANSPPAGSPADSASAGATAARRQIRVRLGGAGPPVAHTSPLSRRLSRLSLARNDVAGSELGERDQFSSPVQPAPGDGASACATPRSRSALGAQLGVTAMVRDTAVSRYASGPRLVRGDAPRPLTSGTASTARSLSPTPGPSEAQTGSGVGGAGVQMDSVAHAALGCRAGSSQLGMRRDAVEDMVTALLAVEAGLGNDWRSQLAVVDCLAQTAGRVSEEMIGSRVVPTLVRHMLESATPVAQAAAQAVVHLARHSGNHSLRKDVLERLVEEVARSPSCWHRELYAVAAVALLDTFSPAFARRHALDPCIELSRDRTVGVRASIVPVLVRLKAAMMLIQDATAIGQVQRCIDTLCSDGSEFVRQRAYTARAHSRAAWSPLHFGGLSRADARADAQRRGEEEEGWDLQEMTMVDTKLRVLEERRKARAAIADEAAASTTTAARPAGGRALAYSGAGAQRPPRAVPASSTSSSASSASTAAYTGSGAAATSASGRGPRRSLRPSAGAGAAIAGPRPGRVPAPPTATVRKVAAAPSGAGAREGQGVAAAVRPRRRSRGAGAIASNAGSAIVSGDSGAGRYRPEGAASVDAGAHARSRADEGEGPTRERRSSWGQQRVQQSPRAVAGRSIVGAAQRQTGLRPSAEGQPRARRDGRSGGRGSAYRVGPQKK